MVKRIEPQTYDQASEQKIGRSPDQIGRIPNHNGVTVGLTMGRSHRGGTIITGGRIQQLNRSFSMEYMQKNWWTHRFHSGMTCENNQWPLPNWWKGADQASTETPELQEASSRFHTMVPTS